MIPYLSLKSLTGRSADEIHAAVRRVIDSGWYLKGEETAAFERAYADYIGTKYAIGCANGFDALSLMLRAYRELDVLREDDEILVPANTFIATIHAILENNLKAVLVEPRFDTLEIDDEKLEEALTPRTKAVLIVHLYGRCAFTDKIAAFCQAHNLKLLEDNAQAHGCTWKGRKTGSLGDAAAHSFYPAKNLGALGDAGAVTTNDAAVADCVRSLGNYGSTTKHVFRYCGRNSRLDEIQAAILNVKLTHLDEDNGRRRCMANAYYEGIDGERVALPVRMPIEENVYHVFPVFSARREALKTHLAASGIETAIHYPIPPHKQDCFKGAIQKGRLVLPKRGLPITEKIAAEELSLPVGSTMTAIEAQRIVEELNHDW